jgi:uncharacterized membrane protein YfcA
MLTTILLILAGMTAGFLNTFAAGGSIIALPVMIGLGLHPMLANTTNHVPVLLGFAAAVWRFHRAGRMPWKEGMKISFPMLGGSLAGAFTASCINDRYTNYVIFAALLLALALILVKPERWFSDSQHEQAITTGTWVLFLSVIVGYWAGLIVIGSGVLTLMLLVLAANFRLPEANAIKALSIGIATAAAVVVFSAKGEIKWGWAITVSAGSVAGSLLAARFVMRPNVGHWVFGVILLSLVVEITRLGFRIFLP